MDRVIYVCSAEAVWLELLDVNGLSALEVDPRLQAVACVYDLDLGFLCIPCV